MAGYTLFRMPAATDSLHILMYLMRAIVCTAPAYALSVLLACVLDEAWQFLGACIAWAGVFLLQSRIDVIARAAPFFEA